MAGEPGPRYAAAADLTYDLSVGAAGVEPSPYEAGLTRLDLPPGDPQAFGLELTSGASTPWRAISGVTAALRALGGLAVARHAQTRRARER